MTKKDCEDTADYLRDMGISADYYHAGQGKAERKTVQSAWLQGKIKVVCATIAYGMGINMPTVRFVIHLSLAKSLEGYYQVHLVSNAWFALIVVIGSWESWKRWRVQRVCAVLQQSGCR